MNLEGYLKQECKYKGKTVYQCWNSEVYYRVKKVTWRGTEYLDIEGGTEGIRRCPQDMHVYQV